MAIEHGFNENIIRECSRIVKENLEYPRRFFSRVDSKMKMDKRNQGSWIRLSNFYRGKTPERKALYGHGVYRKQ